ncbi:MAG: hypothetical protein NVS1B7_7990 [Candidatus Saccharimonadales bacterium]
MSEVNHDETCIHDELESKIAEIITDYRATTPEHLRSDLDEAHAIANAFEQLGWLGKTQPKSGEWLRVWRTRLDDELPVYWLGRTVGAVAIEQLHELNDASEIIDKERD